MGRSGGARHQFPEIAVEGVRLRLEKPSAPRDGGGGEVLAGPAGGRLHSTANSGVLMECVCVCVCARVPASARGCKSVVNCQGVRASLSENQCMWVCVWGGVSLHAWCVRGMEAHVPTCMCPPLSWGCPTAFSPGLLCRLERGGVGQ